MLAVTVRVQSGSGESEMVDVLYSIGHVAALIGTHPQTLREYERQGLLTPPRTAGGTRRYGRDELERLQHIQRLTAEGISLAGVKYVLRIEDNLRTALKRIADLEEIITGHSATSPELSQAAAVIRTTTSMELVHVPRTPRSPRWRNRR